MDVQYLHDGSAVLVLEQGDGEPGHWEGSGPNARWVDNPDYQPARVARLTVESVEQGQIAGSSPDDTAVAARAAAIEAGDFDGREGAQFVHEPAAPSSSPVGSADAVSDAQRANAAPGAATATVTTDQPGAKVGGEPHTASGAPGQPEGPPGTVAQPSAPAEPGTEPAPVTGPQPGV